MGSSKINNISNQKILNSTKEVVPKMKEQKEIYDSFIQQLTKSAESFNDYSSVNAYMDKMCQENSDCMKIDSNFYKYKDFYVVSSLKIAADKQARGLKIGTNLNMSCSPKFVDYITLKNNRDAVLIYKIDGTQNDYIVPYNTCRQDVTLDAKKKFMEDIEKFTKIGYTNQSIEKPSTWYVVPSSKQIIIGDWSNFVALKTEQEKSQYKKDIAGTLGLIY